MFKLDLSLDWIEILSMAGRKVVQDANTNPLSEQSLTEVAPQKTGSAGHKRRTKTSHLVLRSVEPESKLMFSSSFYRES